VLFFTIFLRVAFFFFLFHAVSESTCPSSIHFRFAMSQQNVFRTAPEAILDTEMDEHLSTEPADANAVASNVSYPTPKATPPATEDGHVDVDDTSLEEDPNAEERKEFSYREYFNEEVDDKGVKKRVCKNATSRKKCCATYSGNTSTTILKKHANACFGLALAPVPQRALKGDSALKTWVSQVTQDHVTSLLVAFIVDSQVAFGGFCLAHSSFLDSTLSFCLAAFHNGVARHIPRLFASVGRSAGLQGSRPQNNFAKNQSRI
jgi:hypothetical protein